MPTGQFRDISVVIIFHGPKARPVAPLRTQAQAVMMASPSATWLLVARWGVDIMVICNLRETTNQFDR